MSVFVNGARWLNGAFTGVLNWANSADRTINLPNDSGTLLLDDRAIGSTNSGVSLRGYEPIVTVTATKTLALSDAGTIQDCRNGATAIITVPLNSAVAFPVGTRVLVRKTTAQIVTIAFTAGVTILNEVGGTLASWNLSGSVILRKTATDTWIAEIPIPLSANLPGDATTTTQSAGNISTRIATTAFVDTAATNTVGNLSKVRYLFVIAGESNAGGYAVNTQLTADQLLPQSHLKIWNNTSSVFQPLQIGTNNLLGHTGTPDNATHGLERALAREVLSVLQWPEAYLVKAVQGGSTIAQWSVGNASGYLTTLTNRFNAARAALTTAGFTVRPIFIWMNGINDAVNGTVPATFRTATQAHFTQIRSLMGASTPIFFPKIMPTNAAYIAINTEIATIDTADANLWSPNTQTIPNNPIDPNHYTANGYVEIMRTIVDSIRLNLGIPGSFNIGQSRNITSNPVFSARRSTALSIPANTATAIPLNIQDIDTDTMFRSSDGTCVIPIGCAGIYSISGMASIDGGLQIRTQILVNTVLRAQSPLVSITTNDVYSGEVSKILRLAVGDVVSLSVFQQNTTSAAKNLLTNLEFQATLNLVRIGV